MYDMKTILFIFNNDAFRLPPFLTLVDALKDTYCIKVISCESKDNAERIRQRYLGKNVSFINSVGPDVEMDFKSRVLRKLRRWLGLKPPFHKSASRLLNTESYDLLWIIHEKTLVEFKEQFKGKEYVVSLYELNDKLPKLLAEMKDPLKAAKAVMVPEYNRACILKLWMGLDKIPYIIPNKPGWHPLSRYLECDYSKQLQGEKIVLYQGIVNRNRDISHLCRAVGRINGYKLVLMGRGEEDYIAELRTEYPHILFIPFVNPPEHLKITSYARIGIVKYDWYDMNHLYCAPNKTWEYTGFGIPVLGNELPGLVYTIGSFKAGVLTNLDDEEAIVKAISEIEKNYDEYSANALKYYNSADINKEIISVAECFN